MEELLILSKDKEFARMLSNECLFCGIPAQIFSTYEEHAANAACLLVDLDSIQTLPSDVPPALGFFRDPAAVSEQVRMRCRVIFRRPFPIQELQQELFRFSPRLRDLREGYIPTDNKQNPKSSLPPPPKVVLDSIHMTVTCGKLTAHLSDREFMILSRLYAAHGEPVSKQELDTLLGNRESNMTEVYISRLRKKIEKKLGIRLIESIRGGGYQMRVSV